MPLNVRRRGRARADHFKHVFSRVFRDLDRPPSVPFEVSNDARRIWAKVAKVNSLPALFQKKQAIEALKEFRRRLMDADAFSM